MNVLLFSTDPIALDATMCRLMNLDPALVLTNCAGAEMGAGTYRSEEIRLLGDPIEPFIALDYNVNRKPETDAPKKQQPNFIKQAITPRPYILAERCVRCGICVKMCPVTPKAVDWHDGNKQNPPSYRYERCIRCYCCQELCPERAIQVKVPFLRRVLDRT
ncbi:NAD(P)H-quinone oxidoreductase subunit I, chloroplastic [bioreactor metagenome]|uniref:NAD(P)H-quinone oxidoreductase subunit I, chloroplastic n=1 Tax=bioreactor metagenome TaxID=1076179 RepID=A0A645CMN9_9ZZZZ